MNNQTKNQLSKFIFIFLIICLMSYTNAIDTYPKDEEIRLRFTCTLNSQIPSPSTTYNISIFFDKTGLIIVDNQPAESMGNGIFNFSQTFNVSGFYEIIQVCVDGENNFSSSEFIKVSPGGEELEISESILYFLLLIFVLFLFISSTFFAFAISYKNERNEHGYITIVAKKKYLKLFFIILSYYFLTWLFNLMIAISVNFLPIQHFTGLFSLFYKVLLGMGWPLLLTMIIVVGIFAMRDSKLTEQIQRFGRAE